jgi:DNA-directed RNA polymerase specialized sigma subunit
MKSTLRKQKTIENNVMSSMYSDGKSLLEIARTLGRTQMYIKEQLIKTGQWKRK